MARREYKYLIDELTADRIRRALAGICVPDEFTTSGRYLCDTLYVDTLAFDLYKATIDNARVRAKLRIRTYPETPGAPVFLEVKRRIDDIIVKPRARVAADRWVRVLETGDLEAVDADQRRAAEAFFAEYHGSRRGPLVPQLIIRYEREAYTSLLDDYARVTFDRQIMARTCSDLAFDTGDRGWTPVDHPPAMRVGDGRSFVVLELKFSDRAPAWMLRLVAQFDLPRLAFSKYARAIETIHLGPADRVALM